MYIKFNIFDFLVFFYTFHEGKRLVKLTTQMALITGNKNLPGGMETEF